MSIKILIVDDSSVVRGLLLRELSKDSEIIICDTASDGKMAISMAQHHHPDIVLLDLDMPIMDGIAAIPHILNVSPKSKIIIISGTARHNAKTTLKAISLGALDYITKPEAELGSDKIFFKELLKIIKNVSDHEFDFRVMSSVLEKIPTSIPTPSDVRTSNSKHSKTIKAIAIAASTGGPRALMLLFSMLKGYSLRVPIFITLHMQETFISIFAEELSQKSGFKCFKAQDDEPVIAGRVYIAPGNSHLQVKNVNGSVMIQLSNAAPVNSCRPSADPMFMSLSNIYGENILAAVLTGIGTDGAAGAQSLANAGAIIIAQDMQTSAAYGMPKAVAERGICDAILPIDQIASYIKGIL